MKIKNIIKDIFLNPKRFFLENVGVKQTVFKNTFWLALAEGITYLLKLILIIYIARILGATEYGKFTFALAFTALFVIFSDFGLSKITTREFSREPKKEKEFSSLLSLKIVLALGTLFLILIGSFFITPNPFIQKLIWVLGIFVIIENFSLIIFAFLQARQKMEYQAWAKILEAIIVTGLGFFVLFYCPSVLNLSFSYLFAILIALIFILILFHFKIFPLKLSFQKSIWKNYLKLSWPLALSGVFGAIYTYTDSTMMGYFGQITETGWYNAAQKIIGPILFFISIIGISFFPVLNKSLVESKERLQNIWNYFLGSMVFLAVPILVGGITLASKIINFIYGPAYSPSILAFQILILMAVITMLSYPFTQILVVINQQKKLFWATLAGALINLVLNLILIPRYSLYGAAFTTIATFLLIFFLLFEFTLRFSPISPFNLKFLSNLTSAIIASIPMYFVIIQSLIYNLNIILLILIGGSIYSICFFVCCKIILKKFYG